MILLLFSDKNGKMPQEKECENYLPYISPESLVKVSQKILTGKSYSRNSSDSENDSFFTIIRNVKYYLSVEFSPKDLQMGFKKEQKK